MAAAKRYEYRVVRWCGVDNLNSLGAEGWHVVATIIMTEVVPIHGVTGNTFTDELLLERENSAVEGE